MLTVYNCGQGDAMSIDLTPSCKHHGHNFYIDLGPSSFKHPANPSSKNKLILTHSHCDHTKGVLNAGVSFTETHIPAYLPEIWKILKILNKAKSPHGAPKVNFGSIELAYTGNCSLQCLHINVLNPPLNVNKIFKKKEYDYLYSENGRTISITDEEINDYLQENHSTSLNEILDTQILDQDITMPNGYNSKLFIKAAIKIIKTRAISLQGATIEDILNAFIEKDANRISIVFNYKPENASSMLLTGDADISVFDRIMNEDRACKSKDANRLKSDILKVPHHGSRENLNQKILTAISPKAAVISHNNKHKSNYDSHPHDEIIGLLMYNGIPTYHTNCIKKAKGRPHSKSNSSPKNSLHIDIISGKIKNVDLTIK